MVSSIFLLCLFCADIVTAVTVSHNSFAENFEIFTEDEETEGTRPQALEENPTLFGRAQAARFCRPGVLNTMSEAQKRLRLAQQVCQPRDYNQIVAHFCTRQCSQHTACMRGCGALCKDWLSVVERSAKSQTSRNDAYGVRECVYEGGEDESRTESQYYALKNTLSQRGASIFKSAEKDATSSAEHFVKSLVKVCVLLRKSMKNQKAIDGETPSRGWRLLEGLYNRMYSHARGLSEAQWSAKHGAWTFTQMMQVCDRLRVIVDHTYDSVLSMFDEEVESAQGDARV